MKFWISILCGIFLAMPSGFATDDVDYSDEEEVVEYSDDEDFEYVDESDETEESDDVAIEEVSVNLAVRLTCDEMNVRISELGQVADPDDATLSEITKLKADYRRACNRAAGARAAAASAKREILVNVQPVENETVADDVVVEGDVSNKNNDMSRSAAGVMANSKNRRVGSAPRAKNLMQQKSTVQADETKKSEDVKEDKTETVVEPAEPELTLEQELANLDAGLCADGSKPNKFGCCGDEIFKDLGNTVFGCCPKDGGDCFPPMK